MASFLAPLLGFLSTAGGAAVATGAMSLVGGIADRNHQNRMYRRNDLLKTMKDAKEAGFHPLEALRAGYTQSQIAQAPRISSMGVAANAVDAAASMYRDQMAQDKRNAQIDAEIANIEADTRRMGSIATYSGTTPRVENPSGASGAWGSAPPSERNWVPVYYQDQVQYIEPSQANRLGIKPYDALSAGDIAELGGELAENIASVDMEGDAVSGGYDYIDQEANYLNRGGNRTDGSTPVYPRLRPWDHPLMYQ